MKVAPHPCGSCPYRVDAPLRLWAPIEFMNLLSHDADELNGGVFLCHRHIRDPQGPNRELCAGWLLDQKRRGFPSIQLRLLLMTRKEIIEQVEAVTDGGFEIYDSIAAMCEANGVPR
jgi:hypothetical protein